jgi:hypothetical protein
MTNPSLLVVETWWQSQTTLEAKDSSRWGKGAVDDRFEYAHCLGTQESQPGQEEGELETMRMECVNTSLPRDTTNRTKISTI